ncbi:PspC domain-containing protein [Flavobacterium ardleyense]|uniref:PspC domain-containing protein n=1 Tax=Flavobacterium ardleyense TaxID=2038737 RepID=A0ABW5Z9V0_9FLAO
MNKTISINLGGFFFHIDEDAYQKLSRYFDAVKRSLDPDGRDEIMSDIETRIAELFQERLQNEKQVVGLLEIDQVIAIMGQPEDYKIDDETNSSSTAFKTSSDYTKKSKRLYRDSDNSLLGGVAAGFGHYLNIDPLWIRILFIISPWITFGTSVLIYLILWILIPEALTTSQKLEMKGEPINISSIEKKVKDGIDEIADKLSNLDHQKIADGAGKVGNSISTIILALVTIVGKFFGGLLFIFASLSLLGIFITGIVMIFSAAMPDNYILNNINSPIGLETPLWLQGILFILSFGIPLFFLLILSLKILITNLKSIGKPAKYILLALWILAVGSFIALGINEVTKIAYNGKVIHKEELILTPNDTLFVKFKNNDFYAKNSTRNRSFKLTQDENSKDVIYSNNVSIEIMETDEATPYLRIEKLAKGKSINEAKKRAEKIKYGYKFEGKTLTLDDYILSSVENKLRGQGVEIYLYLPKGTVFKTDKNFENFNQSDNDYFDFRNSLNNIYRVEKKTSTYSYSSDNGRSNTMENDTNATIVFDENGILVKRKVKEMPQEVESVKIEINTKDQNN